LLYALDQFEGTLVFISHDVYFIRALAKHVVHINAGELTHYPGDYQYYLDKTKALSARAALTSTGRDALPRVQADPQVSPTMSRKEQKRLEAEQRQARSNERKHQQQKVHTLEKQIQALELRQQELTAELEKPEAYDHPAHAMKINRELAGIPQHLADLTAQWEAAATELNAANS
jgi:ATP-binding cassette subfamily F protein 3